MRYTFKAPLVAATAVREADNNDHILEASAAPPIKLSAIRNEHNPRVQSGKRLPLKMIISEMASRETDTVETELEHQSVHSHLDNASLHTAPITKRCPGRCFPKKSLGNPVHDPVSHSEHTFFSEIFKGPGDEVASLNCQTVFPETSHFSKVHERCSRCADVKEVFPHGCYSTPCATSRFHCLYGNEVLNKTVKSGLTGPQTHQTEREQWLNNDDKVTYVENYDRKKCNYQSPSSPMPKHFNVDAKYGYDTEPTNDNVSLQQYPLDYSPKNTGSPTFIKHMSESTNATNILCSPLSSTYSSVKTYSGWSTEDEHEQANYKRKPDSEYTSENRFLHPLAKFKSKHQKAENALTDLLYTVKSRNVYNWKPDCKYTVHDLDCITPNMDQRYSTENLSPIYGNCDSGTLHDAVALSGDPICWYQVKYTRRTQSIRISTKLSGLPESEPRDQIHTDLQQVDGSPPSNWDSLSPNHGLNIVPYLSSPEDGSHKQPTSQDLVFTDKLNQA